MPLMFTNEIQSLLHKRSPVAGSTSRYDVKCGLKQSVQKPTGVSAGGVLSSTANMLELQ